jgi:hypothetical protein
VVVGAAVGETGPWPVVRGKAAHLGGYLWLSSGPDGPRVPAALLGLRREDRSVPCAAPEAVG